MIKKASRYLKYCDAFYIENTLCLRDSKNAKNWQRNKCKNLPKMLKNA